MIEDYFSQLEKCLQVFPYIRSYTLNKKVYNTKQGFIRAVVVFDDNTRLEFMEVKHTDITEKIKYRYQYMDEGNSLIFRYDNAPHHEDLNTFPHHKHLPHGVKAHEESSLEGVLLEIAKHRKTSNE